MASVVVGRFAVSADHPSLPGHFPNQPIVPGVVLLDHVLALILPPGRCAAALSGVRFTAAVRAGETIEVSVASSRAGASPATIGFSAAADGQAVLRGVAVLAG